MKNRTRNSMLISTVLIVFVFTGLMIWQAVSAKDIDRILIENKMRNLSIESVKYLDENEETTVVEMIIKNNYKKDYLSSFS